jgi:predicted nucleic acid-binding protein
VICLLDSSTVSLLLRAERNPEVVARYETETEAGSEFVLCPVVAYEVRRGLERRDSQR